MSRNLDTESLVVVLFFLVLAAAMGSGAVYGVYWIVCQLIGLEPL